MFNQEKYVEIDLMKFIPLDSYVTLDPEFKRNMFKNALAKAGSESNLGKKIDIERRTLSSWRLNKRKRMPLRSILKLINYIGISKDNLRYQIVDITAYYDAGAISVKNWIIKFDEKLAELLGIINGDGCIAPNGVWCFNTVAEIPLFFASFCEENFGIEKNRVRITITLPKNLSKKYDEFVKFFNERGYFNIHKEIANSNNKKPLFKFLVCSKVFSNIVKNIRNSLKEQIDQLPLSLMASYVKGFSSAEGCVYKKKIFITNKNKKELNFIKFILKSLGIVSIGPKLKPTGVYHLYISGKNNILEFSRKVGFGRHEIRCNKLKNEISCYMIKHKDERQREILNILREGKKTVSEISNRIGIKYAWTSVILNEMVKKRAISVDKVSRPYRYFVGDFIES